MIDLLLYWTGFSVFTATVVLTALIVRDFIQAWRRRQAEPTERPRPYVAIRRPR